MNDEAKREREPFIFRCRKHNYVQEARVPQIGKQTRVFCPICRDEFFAANIPELHNENPNAGKLKPV